MTPCPCSYCKEWRAKIEARIAELEIDNNYCYECGIDYQNFARDELRKLLE